jgi:integrase
MNTAKLKTEEGRQGQLNRQPQNIIPLPQRQKPKVLVEGHFVIKQFPNASGSQSWRVDGYKRDRTRVRENFAEELRARARANELETEWLKGNTQTEIQATKLTRDQIVLAESAFNRLGPDADDELTLAIDRWLADGRQRAVFESPRLDEAFKEFKTWLADPECALRPLSKKTFRCRVNVFVNSVANLRVADVTVDTVEDYLAKRTISAKSKDIERRAVSRFFSWCAERPRQWTKVNPARKATRSGRTEESAPVVLSVEQCEALLQAAVRVKKGRMAPYIAVCLFGGLRPYEARRLTWTAVNLADGEIRIESHQTKTKRPRVVAICPTLNRWLKAYKGKPFFPSNWRRDLDAVKEAAGLVRRESPEGTRKGHFWKRVVAVDGVIWVPDIFRHTAISHYFRKTGSYGQTAEQFGNSEAIIKRHYQSRVSSEDTRKFYALKPTKKGTR